MEIFTTLAIALGLSMDAFAVSIVSGTTYKHLKTRHAFRMAAFFGAFQAIMPLIGALAGLTVKQYIEHYDHWIAFALLAAVGAKMLCESFKIKSAEHIADPSSIPVLLVLAVATSIDALAVGITLSFLAVNILLAAAIIGVVTFALSYLGVFIGKRFGHFFETKIEALGGLVLIAIGLKILLRHSFP
jgi:putative Mn2+ efflux pump MntP